MALLIVIFFQMKTATEVNLISDCSLIWGTAFKFTKRPNVKLIASTVNCLNVAVGVSARLSGHTEVGESRARAAAITADRAWLRC